MQNSFKNIIKPVKLVPIGIDELMEVAYHEAGHALIMLINGIIPKEGSIIPDEKKNTAGYIENPWTANNCDLDSYIDLNANDPEEWTYERRYNFLMKFILAGMIGGAIYSGKYSWEGAQEDYNNFIDYLLHYFEEGTIDFDWQGIHDDLISILIDNKRHLIKIANDFYKNKILTEEYFKAYLKSNFPDIKPIIEIPQHF